VVVEVIIKGSLVVVGEMLCSHWHCLPVEVTIIECRQLVILAAALEIEHRLGLRHSNLEINCIGGDLGDLLLIFEVVAETRGKRIDYVSWLAQRVGDLSLDIIELLVTESTVVDLAECKNRVAFNDIKVVEWRNESDVPFVYIVPKVSIDVDLEILLIL